MDDITIIIKENTSYVDFAKAVAEIIKDEYGTHNIEPFINELTKQLKDD